MSEVTIAPITSRIREIPTEVIIDQEDGMKTECAINLDHIQTVSKDNVGAYISKLSDAKLDKIKPALFFALGFDK